MKKLIIFSDIDGTLYGDDKKISKFNKEQINNFQKLGNQFVICTGNPYLDKMQHLADFLEVEYSINSNGASIYDFKNKKFIYKNQINKDLANKILEFSIQEKIGLDWWDDDTLYSNKYILEDTVNLIKKTFAPDIKINQTKYIVKDIFKAEFIDSKIKIDKAEKFLKDFDLQVVRMSDNAIEVTNNNVSKGQAAKWLLNYLDIDESNAMAIGDSSNDLSMLESIINSYAMGNASLTIKKVALHKTDDAINGGLGKAIIHFLDKQK